jgi:hypothetical protein
LNPGRRAPLASRRIAESHGRLHEGFDTDESALDDEGGELVSVGAAPEPEPFKTRG